MPEIHILNTGKKTRTNLVTSLLVSLQIDQVPIENVCGGRAKCGKCAVRVLNGGEYLSPVKVSEKKKLESMGAEANTRLACQTYTRGDIEIEVLNIQQKGE
ncbi:MAG: hypothetical protein AMS17_06840 [Spirochaetes bacterium DG_61]|nr:MAG: hypothetical protein AMS17_06840 [Spirochaetes bacterium DG_61]